MQCGHAAIGCDTPGSPEVYINGKKKAAPDRRHRFRRGYMKKRVEQLEKDAEGEDEKAAAIFSTIQLLEPQEQPPSLPNTAVHEVNVSDPPEILAAKLAANALDRASASAVEADDARNKAEEDKREAYAEEATYQLLAAGAEPCFAIPRTDDTTTHPKVVAATKARVEWEQAATSAKINDNVAKVVENAAVTQQDAARAAVAKFEKESGKNINMPGDGDCAAQVRAAADATLAAHEARKTAINDCSAYQIGRVGEQAC
ncbi:unnamed protein product, partial [Sphacelaria rigidula]